MLQDPSRIVNHVIDDLLSGEDLAYLSGDATSEPWSGLDRIFRVLLEVVFHWDDTLLEESLGFSLTLTLPVKNSSMVGQSNLRFPNLPIVDVRVPDNSQGPPGVNQGPRKVIVSSIHDGLLVHRWGAGLLASDEPGADPHGLSAPGQVCRQTSTVVHGTGTNDQDGSTGEGGFPPPDFIHDGGDQDRSGHVTGVSASFAGLCADEIDADFESLRDVLGVTDHLIREKGVGLVACVGDVR